MSASVSHFAGRTVSNPLTRTQVEKLRISGQRNCQLTELDADAHDIDEGEGQVTMTPSGAKMGNAAEVFADIDGVIAVLRAEDDAD